MHQAKERVTRRLLSDSVLLLLDQTQLLPSPSTITHSPPSFSQHTMAGGAAPMLEGNALKGGLKLMPRNYSASRGSRRKDVPIRWAERVLAAFSPILPPRSLQSSPSSSSPVSSSSG